MLWVNGIYSLTILAIYDILFKEPDDLVQQEPC